MTEEGASLARVETLSRRLRDRRIRQAKNLEQVFSLDIFEGVDRGPVVSRQEWFAAIAAELDVEFPPPELEYLCQLTNYLKAPGLGWWQIIRQFDLLSADLENPKRRVLINGQDYFDMLSSIFEIELRAAIIIGDDHEHSGGSWMLYSLRDGHWAWRYGLVREFWGSEVFDRLEDYMDFYSNYDAPTAEEARETASKMPYYTS